MSVRRWRRPPDPPRTPASHRCNRQVRTTAPGGPLARRSRRRKNSFLPALFEREHFAIQRGYRHFADNVVRLRLVTSMALIEFRGDGGASHDQSRDEGAKESFAPAPGVVHELEEAEIQRQLLLRDAPVWPQPGA